MMSMKMILAVAAGGALGAIGRFVITSGAGHWLGQGFPFGVVFVNVLGSFLLGALVELSALTWTPSPELRAFLEVGCLGGLTTFSTFSLDAVTLWQREEFVGAGIYAGGSVVLGVSGFVLGLAAVRSVLA